MNILSANPFQDPRAADSLSGADYVRCFSDFLVPHLPKVFANDNVILRGTQGCGKSMILRLFDPRVRLAYFEAKQEFPIPGPERHFLAGGVNLSKSGILDMIQRLSAAPEDAEFKRLTATFADFLNYWLVDDLLKSCAVMEKHPDCFDNLVNPERYAAFVARIVTQDCWFGYLESCETLAEIRERIENRLTTVRSWANWNEDDLPPDIERTKTVIGEPLACVAAILKESGVLRADAKVFIRIDQMEQLLHKEGEQAHLAEQMRRRIYLALGRRDGRVAYRIGTRTYESLPMTGGRQLEESRDYVVVDFDKELRRGENPGDWLFKRFAEDVFRYRIRAVFPEYVIQGKEKTSLCRRFFGPSPTPQECIQRTIVDQTTSIETLVPMARLPSPWQDWVRAVYLKEATFSKTGVSDGPGGDYRVDPLNGILAFAWALQNGGKQGKQARCETESPPALDGPKPWTIWWSKERLRQAVLQLASGHKQRLFWWGSDHLLALSSNNITLFLSLCGETWDLWQRQLRKQNSQGGVQGFSQVPIEVQMVAFDNVSKQWHRNFTAQPGNPGGDVRIRFLDRVFGDLRERLRKDEQMKNPGWNGFSLLDDELAQFPGLQKLIDEAVVWGDLQRIDHTSKISTDKKRGARHKYYASSILAPFYQMFESHTKEPMYIAPKVLLDFAFSAGALPRPQLELNLPNAQQREQ